MKMTIYIFIVVFCGIMAGYLLISDQVWVFTLHIFNNKIQIGPEQIKKHIDLLIDITLNVTIFFIGIGIGLNKRIFIELKKIGGKILILPMGTILGSLLGGLVTGIILNRSISLSLAISAGFGWYSISAGILNRFAGADIATIGFLSNVFREMLAFILIPILAKKLSPYTAISVGGATTMDTTLPLVSKSTNEQFAVISFIHGALLSLLVPILVPFFANL